MKHTLELTERQVGALWRLLLRDANNTSVARRDWYPLDEIYEAVRQLYESIHGPS